MSNQSAVSSLPFFGVANQKGGVGKSTFSLAAADKLTLDGREPAVIQIDNQQRLSRALGREIMTIQSDPKATRFEAEQELRRFSPLLDAVQSAAGKSPVLIDIGAGEVGRFAHWASLVDLEEDVTEWGFDPLVFFLPFLSEGEAIDQASWTAERLKAALPAVRICLVENQRDGRIADLHPDSSAARAFSRLLRDLGGGVSHLTMPAIPGRSWRHFEVAGCRFDDVVDLPTSEIMQLTGLPRAEAKIARGDIAQWLISMFTELDRVFSGDRS